MSQTRDRTADHKHTYRVDRTGWASGPWDGEPDLVCWVTVGYPAALIRHKNRGHFCGYVGVPREHPWVINAPEAESECHGGITWRSTERTRVRGDNFPVWLPPSLACDEERALQAAILSDLREDTPRGAYADWLREHGRDSEADLLVGSRDLFWFGFDAGHGWDTSPGLDVLFPFHLHSDYATYRDVAYMREQTEILADDARIGALGWAYRPAQVSDTSGVWVWELGVGGGDADGAHLLPPALAARLRGEVIVSPAGCTAISYTSRRAAVEDLLQAATGGN